MARYRTITLPPSSDGYPYHRAIRLAHESGAVVWQTAEAAGWTRLTPAPT